MRERVHIAALASNANANAQPPPATIMTLRNVVGEDACVDVLTEANCFDFGFECLGLVTDALIALAVFPFGFWWQWFADIWEAAELKGAVLRLLSACGRSGCSFVMRRALGGSAGRRDVRSADDDSIDRS